MAATDENLWIKHFVQFGTQFPNDAVQAAQAAAMVHSGYLPAMQGDHLEEFIAGPGADYLPGPYSTIHGAPWLESAIRKQAQRQRATTAAEELAGVPAPPGWESANHLDGRRKSIYGTAFCWAYCADRNCSATCPHERAHNCEFCLASHPTVDCPKAPVNFKHPNAQAAPIKGKGKGKNKGTGKGKGKVKGKNGKCY